MHLVWDLGWFSRTEFTVPRPNMNDGREGASINDIRIFFGFFDPLPLVRIWN